MIAPQLGARIVATATRLPGVPRSTTSLAAALSPPRDARDLEAKTGIAARHWIDASEQATRLGAEVLRDALARAAMEPSSLRRVIFVTSTGGDVLIPANANAVCAALGIDDTADAFDINNACMGFLTAFDVAARSVATGFGPVAVVVVETLSRFLAPTSPRPWLVLADAATAVVLDVARPDEGVLATHLVNRGALRGSVTLAHGGLARSDASPRPLIEFEASNDTLTALATDALRRATATVLHAARCSLDEVTWVLPHQPNGRMLERIEADLGIDARRMIPVVREVGSVGAASIPVALDLLLRTRDVEPGSLILMAGVGAGMAYGATLYRVAP